MCNTCDAGKDLCEMYTYRSSDTYFEVYRSRYIGWRKCVLCSRFAFVLIHFWVWLPCHLSKHVAPYGHVSLHTTSVTKQIA